MYRNTVRLSTSSLHILMLQATTYFSKKKCFHLFWLQEEISTLEQFLSSRKHLLYFIYAKNTQNYAILHTQYAQEQTSSMHKLQKQQ